MLPIKPRSIKSNFLLNALRTFLSMVIPVVVFPYISRVLGPDNIGKVEFANSIVNYFVLFAALGIPTYGIREIARVREDSVKFSKTVAELTMLLFITNMICCLLFVALVLFVPMLNSQQVLFWVVFPNIILSSFNYEWFYTGIEDQLFITVRYIIVKILQVAVIFLLVRDSENYVIYAGLLVGANGLSSVFNIARLKKYVSFVLLKSLELRKHIKPVLVIFGSIVATSIYMQLDITMVGIFVDDNAVGLYTTANKIIRIIISVVTVLGTVMIPRLANNLANNNVEEYRRNLSKSLNFILLLAVPFVFGCIAVADDFVVLFAGDEFAEAGFSMKLLSPIILIVGLAHFVGLQILYSNKKEGIYTLSVSVAAIVNFIANLILIPIYKQNGAVIGTLIAESVGLLLMSVIGRKYISDGKFLNVKLLWYFIAGSLMFAVVVACKEYLGFGFVLQVIVAVVGYGICVIPCRQAVLGKN